MRLAPAGPLDLPGVRRGVPHARAGPALSAVWIPGGSITIMRLNGRAEIMGYLGYKGNRDNSRNWKRTIRDYSPALHYTDGRYYVWALGEDLDALARKRSRTLREIEEAKKKRH